MQPLESRKEIVLGVILLIAALLISAATSYRQTETLHTHSNWVTHTHLVLTALESVTSALARVESSQRGFISTGDHMVGWESG